jgi:hypothetical protein
VRAALYVLAAVAVVVFFIVRQRRSDRFRERSLLFPLALGVYGLVLITQTSDHDSLTAASALLLFLSAIASIAFGVVRGRTIELFLRDHLGCPDAGCSRTGQDHPNRMMRCAVPRGTITTWDCCADGA